MSPVCQCEELERPGRRTGGGDDDVDRRVGGQARADDELELERMARVVLVLEAKRVPDASDVRPPPGDAGMVGRPGELDVDRDLEPVVEQAPGEARRTARDRALGPLLPVERLPPDGDGPDAASSAAHVSGPTTPSSPRGGVRLRWNSITAVRVWPPNLPSTSSIVGTWSDAIVFSFCCSSSTAGPFEFRRIVGWMEPDSGAPRGSPPPGSRPPRGAGGSRAAPARRASPTSSRPQTPSATIGGLDAWNEISAAAVMGSNMAVMRSGGVAAPSAFSACWSSPISTLGPSPCRRTVCVGAGAAGPAAGPAGAAPGASSRWRTAGARAASSDRTAALPALRWSAMTIDEAAWMGSRRGTVPVATRSTASSGVDRVGRAGRAAGSRSGGTIREVFRRGHPHAVRTPNPALLPPPAASSRWTAGAAVSSSSSWATSPPADAAGAGDADGDDIDAITVSAVCSAARSNRSDGSLTRMPPGASRAVDRALGLLDDVAQLVGERPLAAGRARVVLAGLEHDVAADRVGVGADGLRRLRRPVVGVDADVLERLAERRLHRGPGALVERRAAARPDHVMDRGRLLLAREQLDDAGVAGGALQVHEGRRVEAPTTGRTRTGSTRRRRAHGCRAPGRSARRGTVPARNRASRSSCSRSGSATGLRSAMPSGTCARKSARMGSRPPDGRR